VGGAAAATAFGLQARTRARDAEAARDDAREAERRAEEARRASEEGEKRVAEAVGALVGERGKGKDLAERIGELDKQRRDLAGDVTRLQKDLDQFRARQDEADTALPPPRPVTPRLLREVEDLRAELAKTGQELKKLAARPGPYRPPLYQHAQRLLEDGAAGAAETAAAVLAYVPAEHRGWEWNYLARWQRARTYSGREIRSTAGRPVVVRLAPSGERVFSAVVEGSELNTVMIVTTAHLVGATPQVTNVRESANPLGSHQIVSDPTGGPKVLSFFTDTGPGGEQRSAVMLEQLNERDRKARDRNSVKVTDTVFSPATQFVAYREIEQETGQDWRKIRPGIGWQPLWAHRGDGWGAGHALADLPRGRLPVAISDDGGFLAVDSGALYSLPRGVRVGELPFPGVGRPIVFSPKSAWVATPHALDSPFVKVVCTPVRNPADPRREFVGHTGSVRAIAFSADETRMATGGDDGTVRVWDTETAECLLTLKTAGNPAQVVLSPDGKRLVALVEDAKNPTLHHVRVWEARAEKKP
jgi:hypothetical protein